MANSPALPPDPEQLDRIEAALQRIEEWQAKLMAMLVEEQDDEQKGDLDGGEAFGERNPDEPM